MFIFWNLCFIFVIGCNTAVGIVKICEYISMKYNKSPFQIQNRRLFKYFAGEKPRFDKEEK